ncbi:MAG: hypothetical protein KAY37_14855 [Phycisphaerae bacterium]|nr:hypothetical protein [Phycisphaerae bacterium]
MRNDPIRHFPFIEPQASILHGRPTRFKRERPILPLLAPIRLTSRHAERPIRPLPPSERRSCGISAQHQPLPPRIASLRSVAASATLHQWRRHTEPLDAIEDRSEQLTRYGHLGHLKRYVLGVPTPNTDFIAVAEGGYHSLGLKADGSIVAWGWNYYGQCNVPAPNANFVNVAAGGRLDLHYIALPPLAPALTQSFSRPGLAG